MRDLARHEWQRATVADLRAARPDAIVVETGLPDCTATIDTYGAGKVNLEAAADSLRAAASVRQPQVWGFRNFAGRRAGVSSAHYPDLATRSERNLVRRSIQLPSPALVVACLALGVSLTGVGYAAVVLPTNSVGTVQLRDNAVVSKKVQNRSLLAIDFKAGQLPAGPRGLQGEKGANGDTGSKGDKGDKGEKGDKGAKGDAGAAGPPGISGYQVVRGANPVNGTLFHSNTIDCPAGKKVLGGGGFVNGVNGAGPHLVASTPKADGSGWTVTSTKSAGSLAVIGYAICANVTP